MQVYCQSLIPIENLPRDRGKRLLSVTSKVTSYEMYEWHKNFGIFCSLAPEGKLYRPHNVSFIFLCSFCCDKYLSS
jgi:hypothetical protein